MGIRVPAGEHLVHLRFRPVLMWAGTFAAILSFGGAWMGVILGAILRRRKARRVTAPSLAKAA